jgi:uncharacterized protein
MPAKIGIEELARFLNSEFAPDECMGLSGLDGFLTAIVIGPELVLPSEWLPVVWGEQAPEPESDGAKKMVVDAILDRFIEIATCFDTNPEEFEPIFWEGPDGEVIASDWAAGFVDAIGLRPGAWEPLINDPQAGILLAPLLILGDSERRAGHVGAVPEDKLSTAMPDIIPNCVLGIHEFWKIYRNRPNP